MAELPIAVIDFGSYTCKAGFAVPEKDPIVLARSAVLRKDGGHTDADEDAFLYPMQRSVVEDWEQLEVVLHHTLYELLGWEFENEGGLMMAEPMFTSRKSRETMTQLIFERFNCHSYYVAESPVLSLYAANRTTGVVVDAGHGRLDITPVIEGSTVQASACRLNVGGQDLDARLRALVGEQHQLTPALAKTLKHACLSVSPTRLDAQRTGVAATVHTLPDGKQITVRGEGEWCAEALMQPGLLGEGSGGDLSDAVYGAVMSCQEFYARRMMLESVLLCGGGSGVKGMGARLANELHALVPPSTKPEVVAAPDYLPAATLKHAAWCGAAVLARVVFGQQQAITKFEYNEHGPNIVHRKCS